MPQVDKLLAWLGEAQYIIILELPRDTGRFYSHWNHIRTVFVTLFGIYHFRTMPFGFHGIVVIFQ